MRPEPRPSQTVVRRLLTRLLHEPAQLAELATADANVALRAARRGRVLGHLAASLAGHPALEHLPLTARDLLESALVWAEARQRAVLWELDRVALALTGRGVQWRSREPAESAPTEPRIIVLKGCAYALEGLPNSPGRDFTDVDLLFAKQDLPAVEADLTTRGWVFNKLSPYDQHYYRAWTHELPPLVHPERGIEVDLHHAILPQTSRLTPDSRLLLAAAQPIAGTPFWRLSDVDLVLHAMTHLFFDSEFSDSLRDLLDLDRLLRHFSAPDPSFWTRLVERGRVLDLGRPSFYALYFARRVLGTPVPDAALRLAGASAPPRPVLRLMQILIERSLFPEHPDLESPARQLAAARFSLYVRSHWIRMPPFLLLRHLSYKFFRQRIERWPLAGARSD